MCSYYSVTNKILINKWRGDMNIGKYMLIVIVAIELIYTGYCLVTKHNHKKIKGIIRISVFVLFLICLISPLFKWSFRWYFIGGLLLMQAIIGVFSVLKKSKGVTKYRPVRTIFNFIIMSLLFILCLSPLLIFPQYTSLQTTGPYRVATVSFSYVDNNRSEVYSKKDIKRKLNVEFWYPDDLKSSKNAFPLIVFSHGAMGVKTSNASLYQELASNGYVICSIDHTYQCLYTRDEKGKITLLNTGFMKELMNEDVKENIQNSYILYQRWMGILTGDINFVLDTILENVENNSSVNEVYGLINPAEIGVMGHSLGGAAALGIGRTRNDVKAVLALESPYMCDITGIENGQFKWNEQAYPIPVLNIYSDSSWSHLSGWPQYAENERMLSDNQTDTYNVYLQGANHFSLTDLSLASPFLTKVLGGSKPTINTEYCLQTINRVSLGFFDYYLKNSAEFSTQEMYHNQ
jgi:hypothetical protein